MGLKGYRLWVMCQLDSTCRAPPQGIRRVVPPSRADGGDRAGNREDTVGVFRFIHYCDVSLAAAKERRPGVFVCPARPAGTRGRRRRRRRSGSLLLLLIRRRHCSPGHGVCRVGHVSAVKGAEISANNGVGGGASGGFDLYHR
jgi:hypothetical protein